MLSKKYIFCVGASVLMALPVGAQSLEGVVVSASRAEQRSFDAPASIQSVERDVIQDGGPQVNLSESLNRVPGLTILNRQNYAQDLQVSIRGFGARTAFGIRGVRLLIDAKAVLFLIGTEMDYQTGALKSGFVFNNPNQTSACGCGESVQLKPAATG